MPILLAIGSNNKYTLCYWLKILIQFICSYTSLINDNLYNTVSTSKCSYCVVYLKLLPCMFLAL